MERAGAEEGETSLLFGADRARVVNDALGGLRISTGAKDLGLVAEGWQPLWAVEFPLLEEDSDAGRWVALHHPFTAPHPDDVPFLGKAIAVPFGLAHTIWCLTGLKSVADRFVSTRALSSPASLRGARH